MAKKKSGVHIEGHNVEIHGDVVGRDKITYYLIQGIGGLSTDYADRIKNFLIEYLGTPDKPVPFGGRQVELTTLDAWLADPAAPPYALIAAEAGRGKSALLARWMKSILERDLAHVVFIPVSIRFNTALESVTFTALAARLGQIYGEPVKPADMSAQQWRGVCLGYLNRPPPDGKPLLIILDGLDEAADWRAGPDIFPLDPPRGVRALVSARYLGGDVDEQGWLRRLNWEMHGRARGLPLPALTRDGVSDVLTAMGHPLDKLATKVDVIGELFRLSEGDPLLVRLYVEALLPYGGRAAILRPEDLPSIKEGLAGYFERWWEDQRHQWKLQGRDPLAEGADVLNFFNLCASALGPLSTDDAAEIAGGGLTSGLRLKLVAEDVARFVIGDGRTRGYVFSHPRLGQFFSDQMTTQERTAWEAHFLDYGHQTLKALNNGTFPANKAPAYTVQYYGAHLERAEAQAADLYALVSKGWLLAWEAQEGTHSGFLNDTERAWRRAEAEHEIAMQIKCALCRASGIALSTNIPPNLLALAVQHKVLTPLQALVIVKQIPKGWRCVRALAVLAPYLPERERATALQDALAVARTIEDEKSRVDMLVEIAPSLLERERATALQDGLAAARAIETEIYRAHALAALAPHLPEGLMAEALTIAHAIENKETRWGALTAFAPYMPESQRTEALQNALIATRAMTWNEKGQSNALVALAPYLSEYLMAEALIIAHAIKDKETRGLALAALAPYLPKSQRAEALQNALIATQAIWKEEDRANALAELVPYLPEHLMAEAFTATHTIKDEVHRKWVLTALAPHLPERQRQDTLTFAHTIRDIRNRAEMLTALAPHLPEPERVKALQDALAAARAIENEQPRARTLAALAPHLPEHLIAEALTAARAIGDEDDQAKALAALGPYLPESYLAKALQDALTAVWAMWDKERSCTLAALAPYLPESLMADALAATRTIIDKWDHLYALAALAPYLPEGLMDDAFADARTIKDEEHQARALTTLVPYLPEDLIADVLAAARAIKDETFRARVLIALAPHLPEHLMADVLTAARAIEHEGIRAIALAALISHLPERERTEILQDTFIAARAIKDELFRAWALVDLTPHLPELERAEALHDALAAARAVDQETERAHLLAALAPYLHQYLMADVPRFWIKDNQVEVLASLAPHLPEPERTKALQDALAAARAIKYEKRRVRALTTIDSQLFGREGIEALQDALATARTISDEWKRAKEMAFLAPNLASWAQVQPASAYQAWKTTLRELSARPRPEFLSDLRVLMPFTFALVKEEEKTQTAAGILEAIQEVGRWWP